MSDIYILDYLRKIIKNDLKGYNIFLFGGMLRDRYFDVLH